MKDPAETVLIVDRYLEKPHEALALVTLVEKTGSSYRQPGARMLVMRDGSTIGTISGGCLEGDLAKLAFEMEKDGRITELKEIDTRPIFGCQGTITLLIERFDADRAHYSQLMKELQQSFENRQEIALTTQYGESSGKSGTRFALDEEPLATRGGCAGSFRQTLGKRKRLLLIGAHSDIGSVIDLAENLRWQCIQIVPGAQRSAWVSNRQGVLVKHLDAERLLDAIALDESTAVVVMTHNLGRDISYAKEVLKAEFGYIGMLGSKRRRQELMNHLMDLGDEALVLATERLHCPIGLDIGSETREEIALSILSEVQASFAGRGGGKLRETSAPIHPVA